MVARAEGDCQWQQDIRSIRKKGSRSADDRQEFGKETLTNLADVASGGRQGAGRSTGGRSRGGFPNVAFPIAHFPGMVLPLTNVYGLLTRLKGEQRVHGSVGPYCGNGRTCLLGIKRDCRNG